MIDKQKAIEALEVHQGKYKGLFARVVAGCIQVIRELPEDDGWIPVTERMPQKHGAICVNVILLMDDGRVTVGWLNQVTGRGYYLDTVNDVVIKAPLSRFTHWMPLPEPPKEDKT